MKTSEMAADLSTWITESWNRAAHDPERRAQFIQRIGELAPYSGTIPVEVLELAPGEARLRMKDDHSVRNHLQSIHAIALTNLAELTTGLGMLFGAPHSLRMIITGLEIEFVKKARGAISSHSHCPSPDPHRSAEYECRVELTDGSREVVARAKVRWLVSPIEVAGS